MIILYHNNNELVQVVRNGENLDFPKFLMATALVRLAESYPQDWLIWCSEEVASYLNCDNLEKIFHHHKIMASYTLAKQFYIPPAIGYVEESPFIKVNKQVSYPTWLMSADAGGIHASVVLKTGKLIPNEANFEYFLNSMAKLGMIAGLFCYSEPRLLTTINQEGNTKIAAGFFTLFRFVRQHYKKRWLLLLFLNLMLFEKRFPVTPFCYALFFKSRKKIPLNLDSILVRSTKEFESDFSIDVIIPTIGRKKYLYDVLKDLAVQTHLPKKVIIVEQNPMPESLSELDYIKNENWPFQIQHLFTHQAGVCNARNLALAEVSSKWVFLNDDDNRLGNNLIQEVFAKANQYGIDVITTTYLQPNEVQYYKIVHQSGIFGSGNSFVKNSCLKNVRFDKALEFGYGEDTDFGMQLRNQGFDVIYFSDLKITHLKAPMGGFRIQTPKKWDADKIQPKPSPTILYVLQKHYTREQLKSYKLVLSLKLLKHESVHNYVTFYKNFKQRWARSVYWANRLKG